MIKEIWERAVSQAKAVGGDPHKRYIELLESKIETTTLLRDAALKKVADLLMACKASTFFVDESDPSWELYRKLHKLVISILSTSEQVVANDIMKKQTSMKMFRVRIVEFLKKSGFGGAQVLTDAEIVDALEKLVSGKETDHGKDAKESEKAAGARTSADDRK